MFCDVLRVICGCFVFCECFAVFPQNTQKFTKHTKNTSKNTVENTQKTHNTLVSCGRFPRAKKIDCIAQNTFHKTSAKHRKTPQHTRKTVRKRVLRNYIEKQGKTHAKRSKTSQNAVTIKPQNTYCVHSAFGGLSKYVRYVAKAHYAIYA